MNGHDRRRQQIIDRIKKSALELFTIREKDQVSMDEIAARASVSKVTIYKYFHTKDELYREIIDLYVDQILAATKKVLDSELDFTEKLKFTLVAKAQSPKITGSEALLGLLDGVSQQAASGQEKLNRKVKDLMFRFYEQGKKEGYIEDGIPFEMLYLYTQIFDAGFRAKSIEMKPILDDPKSFDQLMRLFYFGVFRKK